MSDAEQGVINQPDSDLDDVFYAHSYKQPDGKYTCELRRLDGTPVVGFGNYDSEMESEVAAMQWYMGYMASREL